MKKIFLMIVCLSTLFTSSCFLKEKEIGQMLFPISIGLSYENDEYTVYLQVLDTSSLSIVETESSSRETSFVLIHASDKDLGNALGKLGLKALTYISAIKVKSIVLHKSILEDSPIDYHNLANYFINTPLFRTKVQLFVTDNKLEEFYSVPYMLVGASVYSHTNEEEPQIIRGFTKPAFLLDYLKSYSENNRMYHIPVMNISEENIDSGDSSGKIKPLKTYKYDGICFTTYDENQMYDCLLKEEARGYRWYSENSFVNLELGESDKQINMIIENVNWKNSINGDDFVINLKFDTVISVNFTDYTLEKIKEEFNRKIKEEINNTLKIAYKKKIDIYHLNDYALRNKKNMQYNYDNVKINIDTKILNTNYYKN